MHSGVVGIATTSPTGALLPCNDALATFCGYASAADLLARTEPPPSRSSSTGRGPPAAVRLGFAPHCRVVVQRPDGGVAWLHASAVREDVGESGPHLEWTIVDATDRYLRLRQQRQSRRLEAVRDLAVSAGAN